MEVNLKTVVADFEKKVTELKREVDNLEKKKLNYQSDIESLSKEQKELKNKVDNLSNTLAKEVEKATQSALDKLNTAEAEIKTEKERLAKSNAALSGKIADYDARIKETERLKENLQASLKEYDGMKKEVDAIKDNLEGVVKVIKEMLE